MASVFAVIEHDGNAVDDTAFELARAGRDAAGDGGKVTALLAGSSVSGLTPGINTWFDEIRVWDDERLEVPDGDRLVSVL
ncbi:MAG TPA: hypothetical protein VIL33_01150, partial [Rhodothermia bacterium]